MTHTDYKNTEQQPETEAPVWTADDEKEFLELHRRREAAKEDEHRANMVSFLEELRRIVEDMEQQPDECSELLNFDYGDTVPEWPADTFVFELHMPFNQLADPRRVYTNIKSIAADNCTVPFLENVPAFLTAIIAKIKSRERIGLTLSVNFDRYPERYKIAQICIPLPNNVYGLDMA